MNADLSLLLSVGVMTVAFAISALVLLVRTDLAPGGVLAGTLDGGGRWFLGAALGVGVIAFTLKLAIIAILSAFPEQTIAPQVPAPGSVGAPSGEPPQPWEPETDPGRYAWKLLPAVTPAPADNPPNPAKIALGERLFHDTALSSDRTVSCATCHDLKGGAGTDRRPTSVGVSRVPGRRNAPTVWNAAYQARLFWDGRAGSLEEQAMGPPLDPGEMGMPSARAVEERIAADPAYPPAFAAAFGDDRPITFVRAAQAIAAFERTLVTDDSPYDRFVRGESGALGPAQQRGMWLFQSIGCVMCHSGPNFSGASLVGPRNPYAPLGASRSEAARAHGLDADRGRAGAGVADGVWRIPSLRNVALTAPYFHNGSVDDLEEAVRVMATAQLGAEISDAPRRRPLPAWSPGTASFDTIERLVLDRRDVADLAAFLRALTSDRLAALAAR